MKEIETNKQMDGMARILSEDNGYIWDAVEASKALYNAGYRKTKWHKVADGDLPNGNRFVLIAVKIESEIVTAPSYFECGNFTLLDTPLLNEKVIAWCELPKYEAHK